MMININNFHPSGLSTSMHCAQHGDLRLIGGMSALEGRVEVCNRERVWNKICNDGWDSEDARVVCRQLGLSPVGEKRKKKTSYCDTNFQALIYSYCTT